MCSIGQRLRRQCERAQKQLPMFSGGKGVARLKGNLFDGRSFAGQDTARMAMGWQNVDLFSFDQEAGSFGAFLLAHSCTIRPHKRRKKVQNAHWCEKEWVIQKPFGGSNRLSLFFLFEDHRKNLSRIDFFQPWIAARQSVRRSDKLKVRFAGGGESVFRKAAM